MNITQHVKTDGMQLKKLTSQMHRDACHHIFHVTLIYHHPQFIIILVMINSSYIIILILKIAFDFENGYCLPFLNRHLEIVHHILIFFCASIIVILLNLSALSRPSLFHLTPSSYYENGFRIWPN